MSISVFYHRRSVEYRGETIEYIDINNGYQFFAYGKSNYFTTLKLAKKFVDGFIKACEDVASEIDCFMQVASECDVKEFLDTLIDL